MFRFGSLRIGQIKSIQIDVNITWLAIFALLVYWLRTGYVAQTAPRMGSSMGWVVSVVGALVLFASVLAHEISHSLVALKNGLRIRRITLFIFGGIAHMDHEPRTAGVELKMALAGPVASLAIAAVFGLLRFAVFKSSPVGAPGLVTQYAAYANLVLAGFNLVPGYPLDGGRVFRAMLWRRTGDFVRSTVIAAAIGRVFGLILVFAGMMFSVALDAPGFIWLAFIGAFLERLAFLSSHRVRTMARPPEPGPAASQEFTWYATAPYYRESYYHTDACDWPGRACDWGSFTGDSHLPHDESRGSDPAEET